MSYDIKFKSHHITFDFPKYRTKYKSTEDESKYIYNIKFVDSNIFMSLTLCDKKDYIEDVNKRRNRKIEEDEYEEFDSYNALISDVLYLQQIEPLSLAGCRKLVFNEDSNTTFGEIVDSDDRGYIYFWFRRLINNILITINLSMPEDNEIDIEKFGLKIIESVKLVFIENL